MTAPARVLILDGETNQALACVRSLAQAGYEVLVASDRRLPLAAWSRHCRRRFRLAGQTLDAFATLRGWARTQGVNIVLPLTERSCLLCNAERPEWESLKITIGCGPNDMLLRAFNKAETIRIAEACGVKVPPTRFPASLAECAAAADEVGFPCVVKPRWTNAWNGTEFLPRKSPRYVSKGDDLMEAVLAAKQNDSWPLIQGFVSGKGRGVFALCDHGRVVAWFAHERLRDVRPTGSSSSLRRSIPLEARLREPAERLLAKLSWHGPAMVEFRDDGVGPPCLMEVNGRFWGSLQLGIDAGTDFPRLWVSVLQGDTIESPIPYKEGLTLRWLLGDIKRLIYIWSGPPSGYHASYPTLWKGIRELLGSQPAGTRLEIWRASDPWPAIGELAEGLRGLFASRAYGGKQLTGK
jgi:predicted ATP-grasp superfamily ATP-dependent carboligase